MPNFTMGTLEPWGSQPVPASVGGSSRPLLRPGVLGQGRPRRVPGRPCSVLGDIGRGHRGGRRH